MYKVELTSRAQHEFDKLTPEGQRRIEGIIGRLGTNPRPAGIRKLYGAIFRIRSGDWRIIYTIIDNNQRVIILKIVRRSEDTYDRIKDLI